MATVYRARHRLLNEMRAVKVVSPRFAHDEDFLWRFRHEAAIARKLRHENAVWVEDLDEIEDGRPFIAMEFLEGRDLRKLIKGEGPLEVERSLKLGAQVASALGAAHKLGIIHRDIKPDNIFIARNSVGNEVAKVLDFGIAKAKEGAMQGAMTATRTGVIIGTPEYMSPEQAEGQLGDKLDGRADLYSLGIVLYEMLTGQLPFHSDTPLGMCLHHLQTVPRPPHELRPDLRIPEVVSAVLMKALEKRREQRFQSADEMLAALRNPESMKPVTNGSGAFAPTQITGKQPGPRDKPTAALTSSALPALNSTGASETSRPAANVAHEIKPAVVKDQGRRWRFILVAIAVVVFAVVGYLVVKINERRDAALLEHDSAIRDLVAQKLESSPALQGRGKNITVTVSSDTVTLGGNASSVGEKDEAGNEAREVPGVAGVINNIAVTAPTIPAPPPAPAKIDDSQPQTKQQPVRSAPAPSVSSPPKRPSKNLGVGDAVASRQLDVLLKIGGQQLDNGNYSAAIAIFQQALKVNPNSSEARNGLRRAQEAQKTEENILKK